MKAEAQTARVIEFDAALRARVNAMANEQLAMQEALPSIPPAQVVAYLDRMDAHADSLSRLAARLEDSDVSRKGAKAQRRKGRSLTMFDAVVGSCAACAAFGVGFGAGALCAWAIGRRGRKTYWAEAAIAMKPRVSNQGVDHV